MNEYQDFIGWLIGMLLAFFGTFFGFFKWLQSQFQDRDEKIDSLNDRVTGVENYLKDELSEIKKEAALNSQRDESNQLLILEKLNLIAVKQEEQSKAQKTQSENITQLSQNMQRIYDLNPELKNPDKP